MAITRSEVERIAELARLEVPAERLARTTEELAKVLAFVEQLRQLDLDGCEPLVFAPAAAALREDARGDRELTREQALAMAPASEQGCFVVPPIVEDLEP